MLHCCMNASDVETGPAYSCIWQEGLVSPTCRGRFAGKDTGFLHRQGSGARGRQGLAACSPRAVLVGGFRDFDLCARDMEHEASRLSSEVNGIATLCQGPERAIPSRQRRVFPLPLACRLRQNRCSNLRQQFRGGTYRGSSEAAC